MNVAVLGRPSGWPPGMVTGILAGVGAGAFWGTTFVAPLIAPGFSSIDLTVGRYLSCGLLSVVLLLWAAARGDAQRPTLAQAGAALWLSLLGYTGYYLLLVLAIQAAGAALTDAHCLQAWRKGHSPSPLGRAAPGSFMKAR